MAEKLKHLSMLIPEEFFEWMTEIKKATGASYGHQIREALKLYARAVKSRGLDAIYPNRKDPTQLH